MKSIIFAATVLIFSGCTHFKDDPSKWVFGEGLWIIGVLLLGGSIKFGIDTYRQHKHGYVKVENGRVTDEPVKYKKWWKSGRFVFAAGLFLAFLYFVISTIVNR